MGEHPLTLEVFRKEMITLLEKYEKTQEKRFEHLEQLIRSQTSGNGSLSPVSKLFNPAPRSAEDIRKDKEIEQQHKKQIEANLQKATSDVASVMNGKSVFPIGVRKYPHPYQNKSVKVAGPFVSPVKKIPAPWKFKHSHATPACRRRRCAPARS